MGEMGGGPGLLSAVSGRSQTIGCNYLPADCLPRLGPSPGSRKGLDGTMTGDWTAVEFTLD